MLLHRAVAFASSASFGSVLAVTAAKLAAINLLPLPALNGGAAIATLSRRMAFNKWWPPFATIALAFVGGIISGAWCAAIIAYAFSA
jgi:Zn-dependent protease